MSPALRSEGWEVHPSFTEHGPTKPVTLLFDDASLTQLAGAPAVAWQIPWSQVGQLRLVRASRTTALCAAIGTTTYVWRARGRRDLADVEVHVRAHGGRVIHRRGRAWSLLVLAFVIVASSVGYLGVRSHHNHGSTTLDDLRKVNLTIRDLPGAWTTSSGSVLSYLLGKANTVLTTPVSTIPTTVDPTSSFAQAGTLFQRCLGVSAQRDRMFGSAGQAPVYQISSPVFTSSLYGGVQVASTTQYYATTAMVRRDTAEMARPNYGACITDAFTSLIVTGAARALTPITDAHNFTPSTFLKGFRAGGVATTAVAAVGLRRAHVVIVSATAEHYEVTLTVLSVQWPQSEQFVDGLVTTLESRMTSPTSGAL